MGTISQGNRISKTINIGGLKQMNKKQLIIIWIMGIIICLSFITTPRKYIVHLQGMVAEFDTPKPASYSVMKWEQPIITSIVTLILGSLLIYTLRDKKK